MSSVAQELDDTLRRVDLQSAQRIERLVRDIPFLAESSGTTVHGDGRSLPDLAAHAEPMGARTNSEIDQAVYGG